MRTSKDLLSFFSCVIFEELRIFNYLVHPADRKRYIQLKLVNTFVRIGSGHVLWPSSRSMESGIKLFFEIEIFVCVCVFMYQFKPYCDAFKTIDYIYYKFFQLTHTAEYGMKEIYRKSNL